MSPAEVLAAVFKAGLRLYWAAMDEGRTINMQEIARTIVPRLRARRRGFMAALVCGALLIVFAAAAFVLSDKDSFAYPTLTLVSMALIPSVALYQALNVLYGRGARRMFLGELAAAGGFSFNESGAFTIGDVLFHDILPEHGSSRTKEGFGGLYKGAPLSFQDAALEDLAQAGAQKSRAREMSAFDGALFRIKLQKKLEGHTVILPHKLLPLFFGDRFSRFQPVKTNHQKFERQYAALTTDPVEARFILGAALSDHVMEMAKIMRARWLKLSFCGDEVFVAAQRLRPLFDGFSLWQAIDEELIMDGGLKALGAVLRLIDILKSNRQVEI